MKNVLMNLKLMIFFAVCPKCGSFETNVTKGKDLKIKKLILV